MSELIAIRDFKMGPATYKRGDRVDPALYAAQRASVRRGMMQHYVLPADRVSDSVRAGNQPIAQPENAHDVREFQRDSVTVHRSRGRPKGSKNKPKGA